MKLEWPEGANYFAVDKNGNGYFYRSKPIPLVSEWNGSVITHSGGEFIKVKVDLTGVFWKSSLIERIPEKTPSFVEIQKLLITHSDK